MNRRDLLRSWKTWAAALAAAGGWPTLVRWVRPPAPEPGETWVDAGSLGDLPATGWAVRDLEVRRRDRWRESVRPLTVYLRRTGGNVEALSAVCPHTGCLVRPDGPGFRCPCHRARFDAGGEAEDGPAPRGLDALPARVARGRIEVRYLEFRSGIVARETVAG